MSSNTLDQALHNAGDANRDARDAQRWLDRLSSGESPPGGWEPVCRDLLAAYLRLEAEHSRIRSQLVRILHIVSPEFRDRH